MQTFQDQLPLQDRLNLLLRAHRAVRFCDDCLALRIGAFSHEVQNALLVIGRRHGFSMEPGVCADCLRARTVVCARAA